MTTKRFSNTMILRQLRTLSLLAMALLVSATAVQAQEAKAAGEAQWELDKVHSKIGFVAYHLGFAETEGRFGKFDAKIKADAKTGKISKLKAVAKTASINTDNKKRDGHLKSADFLDAAKHPELKLSLKAIKFQGKGKFKAKVALTLRGKTKTVIFEGQKRKVVKVNFGAGPELHTAYKAKTTINRQHFGLSFSKFAEGVSIVSDDVDIVLSVELKKKL